MYFNYVTMINNKDINLLDMLDRGNNLTANIPYLNVFIKPESGLLLDDNFCSNLDPL